MLSPVHLDPNYKFTVLPNVPSLVLSSFSIPPTLSPFHTIRTLIASQKCPCVVVWREIVCFQLLVQQVFGLFKWRSPPPAYPSQRQRVDWSRKLCVCFYSGSHKVQPTERAHAGISKGAGRPPSSQRDIAGRRISYRPSYPWLYSALAEWFSELPDWE